MFFTNKSFFVFGVILINIFVKGSASTIDYPGCKFKNKNYELEERPVVKPKWGKNLSDIDYVTLKNQTHYWLLDQLERIQKDVVLDVTINSVDNIIRFYDGYAKARKSFKDYFDDYRADLESKKDYVNQNVEIMQRIRQDKIIKEKFPNIADSMFLAASVPDAEARMNNNDLNFNKFSYFTHFTVAIKTAYFFEYAHKGELDLMHTGFMLLDPEDNWSRPRYIRIFQPESTLSAALYFKSDIMKPDPSFPVITKFICPILHHDVKGWSIESAFMEFKNFKGDPNYIIRYRYTPLPEERQSEPVEDHTLKQAIYVGSTYCSILDTTEKYKVLSPYRSFVKRNKDGLATYGIFVTTYTQNDKTSNIPLTFTLIVTDPDKGLTSSKELPFKVFHESEVANLDDDVKKTVKIVAKNLGLSYEDLIFKIQKLGTIVGDDDFLMNVKNISLVNEVEYFTIGKCVKSISKSLKTSCLHQKNHMKNSKN